MKNKVRGAPSPNPVSPVNTTVTRVYVSGVVTRLRPLARGLVDDNERKTPPPRRGPSRLGNQLEPGVLVAREKGRRETRALPRDDGAVRIVI